MHQLIFYAHRVRNPDALDYMFTRARGEFSYFSYERFEKLLSQRISILKKHPEFKEKLI